MDSFVPDAIVPLLSVLLGAALTYWMNIRTRRRSYVEDIFNQAITAVAVADAARHYIKNVAKPDRLSLSEHQEMLSQIAKAAIETHTKCASDARLALARVYQHAPGVRRYYQDATAVVDKPDEIIAFLQAAKTVATKRRRRRSTADTRSTASPQGVIPFGVDFMIPVKPRSNRADDLGTALGKDAGHL